MMVDVCMPSMDYKLTWTKLLSKVCSFVNSVIFYSSARVECEAYSDSSMMGDAPIERGVADGTTIPSLGAR